MKQLKVSLPDDLRARLDAASAESGRSLGDEIRTRVEQSFEQAAVAKPTRDLQEAVARMAAEIERETSRAWHQHAGAHATLRQAILSRLARLKPKGSTEFGDRPHRAIPATEDPQEIGMWVESRVWQTRDWPAEARERLRLESEKTLREIVALHNNQGQKGKKS
jgi:hypothetical protein